MEINSAMYQAPASDMLTKAQTQTPEKAREVEGSKFAEIDGEKNSALTESRLFDTFEKSEEKSTSNVSGIYHMGKDENGNPKIILEKSGQADKSAAEQSKPGDAQEPEITKCTTNTDKADAEINKLQNEKQKIERQLQSEENAGKRDKLEQQLKNLESEIQTKDNDAYRKQHATYTYG